jgi:hypothetical protein
MKVCVLGCGPAGLLAAHAIKLAGHEPVIHSHLVKSKMFGAMYLHRSIPRITGSSPDFLIRVLKVGTREGYALNVYGDENAAVSWDRFEPGIARGWDLTTAYDNLWDLYRSKIMKADVGSRSIALYQDLYKVVFSTLPAKAMCVDPNHEFKFERIKVYHGLNPIPGAIDDNVMYYNGLQPWNGWYRFSQIRGYQAWEFRADGRPIRQSIKGYQLNDGIKPISSDCNCHPEIKRLGRFGRWDKGVLTHNAFEEVERALQFL